MDVALLLLDVYDGPEYEVAASFPYLDTADVWGCIVFVVVVAPSMDELALPPTGG